MEVLLQNILLPSPLVDLKTSLTIKNSIQLFIKRDDLIHPEVSGNKWRKLQYNLQQISQKEQPVAVTFGGAFSNHIHAFAAACQLLKIKSIGIIRGEDDGNNPTLIFCRKQGMQLYFVSREAYRLKENSPDIISILKNYPAAHLIPEGGTNKLALMGVSHIIEELSQQLSTMPDYIVLAGGTGGTAAGLLSSPILKSKVLVFSSLKSDHLNLEIEQLSNFQNKDRLEVNNQYHFGGYAKWNPQLLQFIDDFEIETRIPLDHVYNGKAMFGLMDLIENKHFQAGTKILYLHTGGLQGKAGLEYILNKHKT